MNGWSILDGGTRRSVQGGEEGGGGAGHHGSPRLSSTNDGAGLMCVSWHESVLLPAYVRELGLLRAGQLCASASLHPSTTHLHLPPSLLHPWNPRRRRVDMCCQRSTEACGALDAVGVRGRQLGGGGEGRVAAGGEDELLGADAEGAVLAADRSLLHHLHRKHAAACAIGGGGRVRGGGVRGGVR